MKLCYRNTGDFQLAAGTYLCKILREFRTNFNLTIKFLKVNKKRVNKKLSKNIVI